MVMMMVRMMMMMLMMILMMSDDDTDDADNGVAYGSYNDVDADGDNDANKQP